MASSMLPMLHSIDLSPMTLKISHFHLLYGVLLTSLKSVQNYAKEI